MKLELYIHWPQAIYVFLMLLGLIEAALKHGQDKGETHNFFRSLVGVMLALLILWWGGFFG